MKYESVVQQALVMSGKKISKWINETHLYELTVQIYPDAIYQYHCEWLGKQSLDIFIPSLGIGIEYQGEQHYRPIEFFGGEKAFKEIVKRDKSKLKKCKDNSVKIIYWRYDEILTINRLKGKIEGKKDKG